MCVAAEDGQNWGFPTYNWAEMAKDNYSWWRARLQSMAKYFHAFRIDHILGFFRIWEIPRSSLSGLMGYFNPSTPVHRHELERLGLWDIQRLTEPYIRWGLLEYYFGSDVSLSRLQVAQWLTFNRLNTYLICTSTFMAGIASSSRRNSTLSVRFWTTSSHFLVCYRRSYKLIGGLTRE